MAVQTQLDTLEAKGLVRPAVYRPELEYLFRHWLVQDAAYGSLLKQERRELHRQVGSALETLYPERRNELAGTLAMHFEQAADTAKALEYLVEAGHYALERNALQEAYSAFERAGAILATTTDAGGEGRKRLRVEIELGRVRAGWSWTSMEAAIEALEAILPDAEELGDTDLLTPLHLLLALTRLQGGQQTSDPAVKRSLDRVTEIGEAIGDPSLRAMPLALTGLMQVFSGPIREGVASLEEAVPLMERREDFIGASFARGALAIGYAQLGEFDKAEAASRNASEIAASGDLIAQLDALIAESMIRAARGDLERAVPLAQKCIDRAEETGASACVMASSWVLGDALHRQGRFADAREALQRGNEISMVVDRKVWRPTLQAWLGSTVAALGDDVTEAELDEALDTARSIDNRVGQAGILFKRAEAAVSRKDWDAALQDFASSVEILESEGMRPSLARALRAWGLALRAAGDTAEGEASLRRALALFDELGLAPEAAIVRLELAAGPMQMLGSA
jgi:tetratricopeptide (TPR) repeat protein